VIGRCSPESSPISSITTHPDQASSRLFIRSQKDSLLLLVICRMTPDQKLGEGRDLHRTIIQILFLVVSIFEGIFECQHDPSIGIR